MKKNIIIGGGLTGLFSALLLAEKFNLKNIIILESTPLIGGAYRGVNFDENHYFDYGPHLYYESSNLEVNKLMLSIMDDKEWLFLEKNDKDIPGIFYQNNLQEHSHYIDLRKEKKYKKYLSDLFNNFNKNKNKNFVTAEDYFQNKFGKYITKSLLKKILLKLWGTNLKKLDPMIAKIVSMDRIIAFDEELMLDLMYTRLIRNNLAYPNQFNFPSDKRTLSQRGVYPKKYGFFQVIDALEKRLLVHGIKIYTSVDIKSFHTQSNQIQSITLILKETSKELIIENINHIHTTIDFLHIANYLKLKNNQDKDIPKQVVYVFLKVKKKPKMGKLYYFYVYDDKYHTFRVTNYANYCESAYLNQEYPLCMEIHFNPKHDVSNINFVELGILELIKMGVIECKKDITYSNYKYFQYGFPSFTLKNKKIAFSNRKKISDRKIINLTLGGISLDKDLFFLHDILDDSYKTLIERFSNE